jgi:hypothetical protein
LDAKVKTPLPLIKIVSSPFERVSVPEVNPVKKPDIETDVSGADGASMLPIGERVG